jgi:AcrR family transcriptional regulator
MARVDREAVLLAAMDLAGEVGIGAFSCREVARRAGVSPAWITRYLGDRDEVLGLVAEAYHGQLATTLVGVFGVAEATGKTQEELCGLIAAHFVMGDPARSLEANSNLMQTFVWLRLTRRPIPHLAIPMGWYPVVGTILGCRLALSTESLLNPVSRNLQLNTLKAVALAVAGVVNTVVSES